MCIVLQSLSYFSDNCINGEGYVVAFFTATLTIVLMRTVSLQLSDSAQPATPESAPDSDVQAAQAKSLRPLDKCSSIQSSMTPAADSCDSSLQPSGTFAGSASGGKSSPRMLVFSLGLAMLLCNAAAGQLGLVQRSSQEAMQKAPPAASTNLIPWVLSQAHLQGTWGLLIELVLLWVPGCLCIALFLGIQSLHGSGGISLKTAAFDRGLNAGGLTGQTVRRFWPWTIVAAMLGLCDRMLAWAASVAVPLSYFCVPVSWAFESPALQHHLQLLGLSLQRVLQSALQGAGLGAVHSWLLHITQRLTGLYDARHCQILLAKIIFACVGFTFASMAARLLAQYLYAYTEAQHTRTPHLLQTGNDDSSGFPAKSDPAKGLSKVSVAVDTRTPSCSEVAQVSNAADKPTLQDSCSRVPSFLSIVGTPAMLVMGRTSVLPLCFFLVEHECLWRLLHLPRSAPASEALEASNSQQSQEVSTRLFLAFKLLLPSCSTCHARVCCLLSSATSDQTEVDGALSA